MRQPTLKSHAVWLNIATSISVSLRCSNDVYQYPSYVDFTEYKYKIYRSLIILKQRFYLIYIKRKVEDCNRICTFDSTHFT